jgi:hypothetical protein
MNSLIDWSGESVALTALRDRTAIEESPDM